MARDKNSRGFAQQKQQRRKWLTFMRMCRYGVNNFSRNAWLTVAATAVMTITLIIVFVTVVAQNVLADTTTEVAKKIDRSIYLRTGTSETQARPIINDLRSLSNVATVDFVSSEEGKQAFANDNKQSSGTLNALKEAENQIPATIRVTLKDVNDTSQLANFVKTNQPLKRYLDPVRQPTFIGQRKSATDTIAGWTRAAQQVGVIASVIFTAISMLIIFNTIRMAIFNRKDEIEMMKLIGADKSFIRGPFVVEAVVYGFIAAVIATVIGIGLLYAMKDKLTSYGMAITPTLDFLTSYIGIIILGMILLGALVGTVSSLLATRRYLKI